MTPLRRGSSMITDMAYSSSTSIRKNEISNARIEDPDLPPAPLHHPLTLIGIHVGNHVCAPILCTCESYIYLFDVFTHMGVAYSTNFSHSVSH